MEEKEGKEREGEGAREGGSESKRKKISKGGKGFGREKERGQIWRDEERWRERKARNEYERARARNISSEGTQAPTTGPREKPAEPGPRERFTAGGAAGRVSESRLSPFGLGYVPAPRIRQANFLEGTSLSGIHNFGARDGPAARVTQSRRSRR